ncbi:MAG TPA: alkaline phosphatase family protein [Acidimicrobiales bacterium]|nr:alkaline phosphatase family protein [Acidimicrobiales bacterium]
MRVTRRQFLKGAAAAGAAVSLGEATRVPRAGARPGALPAPNASGVDHIVVVCMENRSFDHYLGWVPGADGRQAGLSYRDDAGEWHDTHHLTDWSGCGFNDPDHSVTGGRLQLDGGRCDGFRRGANDDYALGYYTREDLPTNAFLVDNFTVCDRWFCGILGPTYPNRFYTHAATTDRLDNTSTTSTLPTIWDRLSAAGVSATYYFSDLPFLALWGQKYISTSQPVAAFFADAAAGTLPSFSYLDPFFLGEGQGGSNDDHPHADIRRGQAFLADVVRAVMGGPLWQKTMLLITYDEWGGFFEHVPPPRMPDRTGPAVAPLQLGQTGFRVPGYIVSPFARRGAVDSTVLNHGSIAALLEWRFGLKALQPRDAASANPARLLEFSRRNPTEASAVPTVVDPGPHLCVSNSAVGVDAPAGMANTEVFWEELAASPLMKGWDRV